MRFPSAVNIMMIVLCGLTIAGGQGCLTLYARDLPASFGVEPVLRYSLSSWKLYGFLMLYSIGLLLMVMLLRELPLAQVTISIVAVVMLASVIFTFLLGQNLSWMQLTGTVLILAGSVFLQARP